VEGKLLVKGTEKAEGMNEDMYQEQNSSTSQNKYTLHFITLQRSNPSWIHKRML
jgi:hypothetical protein